MSNEEPSMSAPEDPVSSTAGQPDPLERAHARLDEACAKVAQFAKRHGRFCLAEAQDGASGAKRVADCLQGEGAFRVRLL